MPDTTNPTVNPATDSILHINEKQFQTVLTSLLKKTNERIAAHLSLNVTEGDTKHAPVGGAVYTAIQDAIVTSTDNGAAKAKEYTDEQVELLTETILGINNWSFEKITGEFPTDPDPKTIYLQQDSTEDLSYIMWVNTNDEWIDIGNTAFDLLDYWRKDNIKGLTDALTSSEYFMTKLFSGNGTEPDPTEVVQQVGEPFVITADPGSTVTATHPDGDEVSVVADENGKAILILNKTGAWAIKITTNGIEEEKTIDVDDTPIIPTGGEISLTVTPNATVTAVHPDGTTVSATADEDGKVTLILPKEGDWDIQVTDPDDGSTSSAGTVTVEDPKPTTTISPLVVSADPGTTVTATHEDGVTTVTATANSEGQAVLVLPKEGSWTLSYTKDGNSETDPITVEEPTTTTIEPVVVYADPNSTVTATHTDGTIITTTADSEGKAVFLLPKEGAWTITYEKDGTEVTNDINATEPELPSAGTLDDRYWEKSKIEELFTAINDLDRFFNRTDKSHYTDLFGVLSNDNETALANTTLSSDDAIEIKSSAVTALDDLTYIRERVLAELLGAVEEKEIGDTVNGTPWDTSGSESDFVPATITLPTAGTWKITGIYTKNIGEDTSEEVTETWYQEVTEDQAPLEVNILTDLGSSNFHHTVSAVQVEKTPILPLTPEVVNNTIVETIQDSGALGTLGEEDLANLKEQLELDKLGDTYLTLDATHEAFDIPEEDEINNETMEDAIMRIVNKNSDQIEAISDERLEELMDMAFGDTIPDLDPDPEDPNKANYKLTVNGDPDTTVVATHTDGSTVTGTVGETGKVTITLNKKGTWTVVYTNSDTEETDTVEVTEDGESTMGTPIDEEITHTINVTGLPVDENGITVTATLGSELKEATSTDGTASFDVTTKGTWNISAMVEDRKVTESVDVDSNGTSSVSFDGYLLTVTGEPNTPVVFTNDSDSNTFTKNTNSNGVLNVLLKSTGNWTVKTEVDGAEVTKTANVTDTTSTDNPTLNFTYPLIFKGDPNTAITAVNGSTTLNGTLNDSGDGVLIGKEAGQWVCTVTRKDSEIQDAVIITDGKYDATDIMGDRSNVATDEEVEEGLKDIFGS